MRYFEAIVALWEACEGGSTYYLAAIDEAEARRALERETCVHDRAEWRECQADEVVVVDGDFGPESRVIGALAPGAVMSLGW